MIHLVKCCGSRRRLTWTIIWTISLVEEDLSSCGDKLSEATLASELTKS